MPADFQLLLHLDPAVLLPRIDIFKTPVVDSGEARLQPVKKRGAQPTFQNVEWPAITVQGGDAVDAHQAQVRVAQLARGNLAVGTIVIGKVPCQLLQDTSSLGGRISQSGGGRGSTTGGGRSSLSGSRGGRSSLNGSRGGSSNLSNNTGNGRSLRNGQ